jgi:2-keto-4-pentenoate hydratase/2-oxohepta-3-ene-1,7-dioic acid hydratase in catechol pathway
MESLVGPVLVSANSISNPQSLSVKSILNGKTMQDGNTSDMIFSVYELVAYLSQGTTLEPGTILLTGTPEGIGYFRSPRVFLDHGDDMRVSIGSIGTLINKIEYE